jgi:transcriptional regulator with XRE-family HTH domain
MAKRPKREPTPRSARTPGERIRAAYHAKGWNRSQFQRAIGMAYTTILAWEEDEVTPKGETLRHLSVVLGVSPSYILGEDMPVTEEQYAEWGSFLDTEMGRGMSRDERVILGSGRYTDGEPPSVERYTALLLALRMTKKTAES